MTSSPDPAVLSEARALKPCPFCGADARRFTIGEDEPNNAGGDVIVCTRCQASSHVEFGRKENLVSFWNRRIVDDLVATISNFTHSGDDGFNFDRDPDDDRYTIDSLIEQARHLRATPPASDAPASGAAEVDPWREAIIDGLIVAHIYSERHDVDPRKALHDLICWEVDVALDPRVSQRAADLAATSPKVASECPSSPDGQHQVDTSMEEGPSNCFHCSAKMGTHHAR